MLGRAFSPHLLKRTPATDRPYLELEGVSALGDRGLPALKGVTLTVHAGEIVGVAGVAGNGQKELAEVIVGARPVTGGRIRINGRDVTALSVSGRVRDLAYIPEEAARFGIFPNLSLADNLILKTHAFPRYSRAFCLNARAIREHADRLIREFDVRAAGPLTPAKLLSGGNQQRLLLARELTQGAPVVVAAQPTQGLDVAAAEAVHQRLIEERERGHAILLISPDLGEILRLSDWIVVLYEGEIRAVLQAERADPNEVGLLIGGGRRRPESDEPPEIPRG
jgi:simple sugar transport system ATP-binding protein